MKPRKIKTPIQEESEIETLDKYENHYKQKSVDVGTEVESSRPKIKQTRTSELRQNRASSEAARSTRKSRSSRSGLKKDVLQEISASLDQSEEEGSESYYEKDKSSPEYLYTADSLEEISPRSEKTTDSGRIRSYRSESSSRRHNHSKPARSERHSRSESLDLRKRRDSLEQKHRRRGSQSPPPPAYISKRRSTEQESNELQRQRYRSESDLRSAAAVQKSSEPKKMGKSMSHADLGSSAKEHQATKKYRPVQAKRTSRYMEWYKKDKGKDKDEPHQPQDKKSKKKSDLGGDDDKVNKPAAVESRLYKETVSSSSKKVDSSNKNNLGPDHPLLQHSEHRFEAQYQVKKRPEEDADSGIVLSKPEMAQKKSVFTIAYNDMHTSQLRPDSSVNTP